MNPEILKLAKECRAFHYPDGATVFPINTLEAFYKAAYNRAIDDAVKACSKVGRYTAECPEMAGYCGDAVRELEMKP